MIDSHIHLDIDSYDQDREQVISRAFENGLKALINVGDSAVSSRKSIELAAQYDSIYAAVGMHPYEFNDLAKIGQQQKELAEIEKLAREKKVVAIGEIGLDYHSHTKEPVSVEQKKNQQQGFFKQLEIAQHYNLPVIIHCRDAYEEILKSKKEIGKLQVVLHCYGGGVAVTKKFLELDNFFFSFTGNITYAKAAAEILAVIRLIPLEKIMLETDGPFLSPVPFRGKRNEPMYVKYVLEKLAEIKNISAKEIEKITDKNAWEFFGIR